MPPFVARRASPTDGCAKPGESKTDLLRLTHVYRDELERLERRGAPAGPIIRRDAWVAQSTEQAWQEALPALHFHYTRDYSFIPSDASLDDMREYGRDRFLIGDPEHLLQEIRWYRDELGASRLVLALDHPGLAPEAVLTAISTIGEAVLPRLQMDHQATAAFRRNA
jgi:alkanesulfonate monooxygenase SsuD/methylene tetrahydromethanopterin reductase-like flavin-dependent oxidoreductase (luciferase family)